MSQPLLAAIAAGLATAGVMLVVAGLVPSPSASRPRSRLASAGARLLGRDLTASQRRRRRVTLAVAVVVAGGTWAYTAIAVAGVIAGVSVIGVPWLFAAGRAERLAIDQLEGIEIWTRRLSDLVRTGVGLNQAIIVSTRDAPAAIGEPLRALGEGLRAGMPTELALDRLADTLADASGDEVIVRLKLHVTDRGPRLVAVLDLIAESISREIAMRREVWAARADPRLTTRFMTVLSVLVVAALFVNGDYVEPYREALGQLVLTVTTATYVGLLVWIRRLSQPRPIPRLLTTRTGEGPS